MTLRELINSVDSELYSDRSTTKGIVLILVKFQ